jgi:hypothetical protein
LDVSKKILEVTKIFVFDFEFFIVEEVIQVLSLKLYDDDLLADTIIESHFEQERS